MQSVSLKCSCIYCLKVLNFTLTEYPLQKLVVIHRIPKHLEIFLHKLSLRFHLNTPKLLTISMGNLKLLKEDKLGAPRDSRSTLQK